MLITKSRKLYLFLFVLTVIICLAFSFQSIKAENNPIDSQIEQGAYFFSKGQYLEAISTLENLPNVSSDINQATIDSYLGSAYYNIGQISKSISHWQAAASFYLSSQDNKRLAGVLVDLAQAYNTLGQFKRAIPLLEEALTLDKDSKTQLVATGVLGTSHLIAGDYERAIEAYQKSLNMASNLNIQEYQVIILNNLTKAYSLRSQQYQQIALEATSEKNTEESVLNESLSEGDKKAAYSTAHQAVIASENKINFDTVTAYLNLMKLSSVDYREQVSQILSQLPPTRQKAYGLINLAAVEPANIAIKDLEAAIALCQKIDDQRTLSEALGKLGSLYEKNGQYSRALKSTQQAQNAAQLVSAQDLLYHWLWQAGRIYNQIGDAEATVIAYRQALATLQTIRGDISRANKQLQLNFRQDIKPFYQQLLRLLLEQKDEIALKEAISVVELSQLSELQNFFGDDCVVLTKPELSTEEILALSNTAVIYSVILDNKTYIILLLPHGEVKKYAIDITAQQLYELVQQERNQLEEVTTNLYLEISQRLYDLLIRPLEADLKQASPKTLLFINDGILRNIPMAVLYDGSEFLVQKYVIANTLGLSLTPLSLKKNPLEPVIFGLSVPVSSFEPLSFVEIETQKIENILGGSRFLNQDFTIKNLGKQLQKDYSIVHIATHGSFGGTLNSAYLQAFDGRINLIELEKLLSSSSKIDLLTLSACQTAAGNDQSVLGLGGVAIRSNVKSVLGTLWSVNDADIVALITDFYENLRKPDISLSEALALSQREEIARSTSHPALWSSLILLGNWL